MVPNPTNHRPSRLFRADGGFSLPSFAPRGNGNDWLQVPYKDAGVFTVKSIRVAYEVRLTLPWKSWAGVTSRSSTSFETPVTGLVPPARLSKGKGT